MKECTEYTTEDFDETQNRPCHCPVCGGFLKWSDILEDPVCNKCHTRLVAIPDPESDETAEWGKICVLKPF